MIDNLNISSPSAGTLRIQGEADADRVEYLIQDAPGSVPSSDAEPTGQAEVSRGEAFSVDVTGISPGQRRVFVRGVDTQAKIYTVTTQSGTSPTGTHTQLPTRDAVRVWIDETPVDEPFFYLYVRHGASTIKLRMNRFESRLLRIQPGESFGFATEDGRSIQFSYDNAPTSLTSSFPVSGTAACDKAGPPLWEPTAPHITLSGGKSFQIESDGTDRIVFVSEHDGESWSPPRWLRVAESGGVRYHATFKHIAIANYAGDSIGISAPEGSVIGGESAVMHLEMPEVTGTTHNVSDVAGLKAAIASAVAGDEIVLADGTYALDINITASSFIANHGVGGRVGMEGITIRSASDNRGDCIVSSAGASTNDWSIVQTGAAEKSYIRGITFDFAGQSVGFSVTCGKWAMENCRFTGAGGSKDGFNFVGSAEGAGIQLDCLRCQCDNAAADCFNGNTGVDGADRCRFIDCEAFNTGPASSNQCITSHNNLHVEMYGGHYYQAQSNVVAPASGAKMLMFFTKTSRGSRGGGVVAEMTFGCDLGASANPGNDLSVKYILASRFGNVIRESSNGSRTVVGNIISADEDLGLVNAYYPNVVTDTIFDFNLVSGATSAIRVDNGSGSASANHNTLVDASRGVAMANGSMVVSLRGNATKNTSTRSLDLTADQMANLTTRGNVWGTPVDTDLVPGEGDLVGDDAQLDSLLFPTEDGNCDGNGDPSFVDWVGGTDAWGYPLRLASSVMDRGARCRPRIIEGAELLPDLW